MRLDIETCQSRMSGFERPVLAPPLPARVHGISWRRFAFCIAWVCRSLPTALGAFLHLQRWHSVRLAESVTVLRRRRFSRLGSGKVPQPRAAGARGRGFMFTSLIVI